MSWNSTPLLTLPQGDRQPLSIRAKALVFNDPRSRQLLEFLDRVGPSEVPVLINGETGTGKELVATEDVRERIAARRVTISLIPMFGINLFIPRLAEYLAQHPGVEVNVTYANHRSYPSDAADLSIRFGTGQWPGYTSELLVSGAVTPWCSPAFIERHGALDRPEDLLEVPLLHDEERGTWPQWLQNAGVRQSNSHSGLLFEDGQLALSAVLAGLGCALLREPLVKPLQERGELVRLSAIALDDTRAYYLCRRSDGELSHESLSLYGWIRHALFAC